MLGEIMLKKVTGYSKYIVEAKNRTKYNPLKDFYPELPNKKYEIIYADPPWDYNGKMQFDKSGKSIEQIDLNKNIFISSASFQYPTVKTKDLMNLNVQKISADNCLLFMWSTNPHLNQAIKLGESWGFEYKTIAFIWDKQSHNPGQYTLSNCEVCLVFKKGKIPKPRGARNIQQLIKHPRSKHSEKPSIVRENIFKMFPTQSKIELFARHNNENWDSWGLEANNELNNF
jgi:N6-adenosine-specific RNA methylase IME4